MSIIPDTIRKQKEYIADSNGNHTLVSRWTSAETVEMPNGDTLDQYSFADEKVKQTIDDDSNTAFDVLFSESSENVTSTEGTKKTSKFRYVPEPSNIVLTNGESGDNSNTAIISPSDVALFGTDNTWDGTHTSLKQAVTAAAASGGVSDVRVNGVSKVVDHVAQIKSYKVVTQAEYDALDNPETDVMYCIRDASVSDGSLSNLVDVDIETPSNGQILKYDSVNRKWANGNEITYSDFDGSTHGLVPPVSTQAGKYLKDDGTWGTPSGVSTLEALTDVTITTPSSGQVLKYDATNNVWVNDTDSGANDAVTQTATDSTDAIYEVLFSNTADNTTRTEGARKSSNLTYNPSDKCLSIKEIETQEGVDYESYMDMYPDTIAMIDELKSSAIMISINSDGGHYYMSNGNNNTALSVDTNDIRLLGTGDTWDGTHTSLKDAIAASGGGGTTVSITPTLQSGTKIAEFEIDGVSGDLFAPSGGSGVSDLDDLGDVNISNPTGGQVLKYDDASSKWINVDSESGETVKWSKLINVRATSTSGSFGGQNAVFDLTSYADYQNINAENIIIQWNSYYHSNAYGVTPCTISKTYNSVTGELTITTPICPFYQGQYTIDIIIASGEIINRQVSPTSMNGNTAYYDLTYIDDYSELGVDDIAFEMDEITHTTNYNLQHNITYSYDSSNGIFSASTDTSIFLNSEATIAIKKAKDAKKIISALTSAQYNALTSAEKNNGTTYLVNGGGETEYMFSHTVQGTTYGYEQLSDSIVHLATLVSLNNVVYGGFIHDYIQKNTRIMEESELSYFATQLEMTYNANSTVSLNTTNPSMPTMNWRNGSNTDTLYLDASSTNVGIKCGFSGCKSHLFYTQIRGNSIIRNEIIYSEYMASGAGVAATLLETTSSDYNSLPSDEKQDASKLYFIKDSGTTEIDTDVVVAGFRNLSEGAVTISINEDGKLEYAWGGATTIGAESVYQTPIPADVQKIKFKITTGSAYSTTSNAWKVCVGLKESYNITNWSYATDSDFLVKEIFATTNSVFEAELDCSSITTDSYLYILGHGWSMVVDYLKTTTEQQIFATRMMYKDIPYASIKGVESDDYEALTPIQKNDGSIYFVKPSNSGFNKICYMGETYGGNNISYGTAAPISGDNDKDGDLYFLLSGGRKIAEFLCIDGNWTLIDGSMPLMQYVFYQSRRNSDDSDTYTATNPCTLLCINQNMNGEASTQTLTSTITTTGTIIDEDVYETSWSSPNRNQCTRVAFIQMSAGDTITFANTHTGNYTTQMHAILDISAYVRVEDITRVVSEAKADNTYGNTETYSLLDNGLYFVYCFQSGGNGQVTNYGTINCNNTDADIIEMARGEVIESLSVALTTYPDTLTFGWGNISGYATKGYAVYKLS